MIDLSRYCGIPFKEKGSSWSGCNCWGVVKLFYKNEFGIDLESHDREYADLKNVETVRAIAETERTKWRGVYPPGKIGDVVEMPLFKKDFHVGVVAAPGFILHVEEGARSEVVPEKSFRIARRIKNGSGYWRYGIAG